MFELEYKKIDKNPLHLLFDERREFPKEVEEQVQKLWKTAPAPHRDEEKFVVKEVLEIEGREVYLMHAVHFRHIYAMLANYKNIKQGLQPIIPRLHLSLANPIGKFQIPSTEQGFQTQSILGQDRERNQLSAIGGHLDREDFTECRLPNGMKPIAPLRPDGRLDIQSIIAMCRAMEEAEQQFEIIDCPATCCVLREGKEEGGIDCYTLKPIGKCEKIYITPFGEKRIIENWPVYNLIPEKETTYEELMQTFHDYDRTLRKQNGEREFASLKPFSNHLPELMELLDSELFAQLPQRPSVEPVLRVEADHQKRLIRWQLNEARQPSLPPLHVNPGFKKSSLFEQVERILRTAMEQTSKQPPILVKGDDRSRI